MRGPYRGTGRTVPAPCRSAHRRLARSAAEGCGRLVPIMRGPCRQSRKLEVGKGGFSLDTPPVRVKIWRPPGGNSHCVWTLARAMRKTTMTHLDRRAFLIGTTAALSAAVAPHIAAAA